MRRNSKIEWYFGGVSANAVRKPPWRDHDGRALSISYLMKRVTACHLERSFEPFPLVVNEFPPTIRVETMD